MSDDEHYEYDVHVLDVFKGASQTNIEESVRVFSQQLQPGGWKLIERFLKPTVDKDAAELILKFRRPKKQV